jgi:hypothetical protein
VAHAVAYRYILPSNFDKWELTDNDGNTVAQVAYEHNTFPPNFNRWDLIKKR